MDGASHSDMYVDFTDGFVFDGTDTKLTVSCDSNYTLYINGTFVDSGQYPDFPYYKVYDKIDITKYCTHGKNRIDITVWYYGQSNMGYFVGDPKLWYSVSTVSGRPEVLGEWVQMVNEAIDRKWKP